MSVRFLAGPAGPGKTEYIYRQILREAMEHPYESFLLLVPEQSSIMVQQELIKIGERHGLLNLQVVTFSRLAYRIFDELMLTNRKLLDENGKVMILRKVAAEKKKELTYFGSNLDRPGFFKELRSLISEFMQCSVMPATLQELEKKASAHPLLLHKLHDLSILYEGFQNALKDRYTTAEEQTELLAGCIGKSSWIASSHIYVDQFNGFTPVQYHVLEEMMRYSLDFCMILTARNGELKKDGSEYALFSMSGAVYKRLTGICQAQTGKEPGLTELPGDFCKKYSSEELYHLQNQFDLYPGTPYPKKPEQIHLSVRKNPEEEVQFVLSEVLSLIRKGMFFRDIAILTGDLGTYGPLIQYYFEKADIPFFLDDKKSMKENPVVIFLSAALDIVKESFSFDSMFHFLKCGLVSLPENLTRRMENYVLALGIRGFKGWSEPWERTYPGLEPAFVEEYNVSRAFLMERLTPFYETIRKKDATVKERIDSLKALMAAFEVELSIDTFAEAFGKEGDFAREMEYEQAMDAVLALLSQYQDLMGDEFIPFSDFCAVLTAGFEELQVGVLPPTMDRMIVGDLRRTRVGFTRVVLLIGANEGHIPTLVRSGGILTEPDRAFFDECQVELAVSSRKENFQQRFLLYLALSRPSEELFISCSRVSTDGKTLRPSVLYSDIRRIFPQIKIEEEGFLGLLTPESSLGYLAEGLRAYKEGKDDPEWKQVFLWYQGRKEWEPVLRQLIDGAFYVYQRESLGSKAAMALYGERPVSSVTRLEAFASCAYAHFLNYGLNLKERREYELKAADFGNIYHNALELFFDKLSEKGVSLGTITEDLRYQLVEESVREVTEGYGNRILGSSAKNRFLTEQIMAVTDRTVWALGNQLSLGDFETTDAELTFLPGDRLKSMQLMTEDGKRVTLGGRIDRIDLAFEEDKVFVRIIDYKSGSTAFDYTRLYYGLSLQLALYMNAALELVQKKYPDKEVIPAGIFYYNIQDPMLEEETAVSEEEMDGKRMRELRMNGLVSCEEVVLPHQEHARVKQSRLIKGVTYQEDGKMSGRGNALSNEQMRRVCDYARDRAQELSTSLYRGEAAVNPYEYKSMESCTYCPFSSVCGFDESIPGYRKRRLLEIDSDEFWKKIEDEIGGTDGSQMDKQPEEGN